MRNRNPLPGLAWTFLLDDGGPVLAALAGEDRFLLSATIGGIDTLLASQSLERAIPSGVLLAPLVTGAAPPKLPP